MERVRDQPAPSKDHLCGFDDDGVDDDGHDGDDGGDGNGGEYNDENQPVVGGRL